MFSLFRQGMYLQFSTYPLLYLVFAYLHNPSFDFKQITLEELMGGVEMYTIYLIRKVLPLI